MLLRFAFSLATASLLVCLPAAAPIAEPVSRGAIDNPFVAQARPVERRFDEWRRALRLSAEQEKLFAAMEGYIRRAAEDRDAAIVAAVIDRNRETRLPRDPGEHLRARADRLSRHAEHLRALADAETSFFASLSDEQRRIADDVLPKDVLGLRDIFRRRSAPSERNG
jgi:hypothetical protein